MNTNKLAKTLLLSFISLFSMPSLAQQDKVVRFYHKGEVIKEYNINEIDYVDIQDSEPEGVINGHEYVDLGLPSGLKWATCNVGASTPSEYGNYFAWGETAPKSEYTNANYGPGGNRLKNISGDPQYDAARANWGGTWRMPTRLEQEELRAYCEWETMTRDGIAGALVTGPNGNQIFLPLTGYMYLSVIDLVGVSGRLWSSEDQGSWASYTLLFNGSTCSETQMSKYYGQCVRAVSE